MMNCRKAEELLPLFVEDDLETTEMQQVREHLETCGACRDSAAEFQASQSSLRATVLPVFDEATLSEMRRDVLQQIAPPAARPAFIGWLQPLWSWKLAFATAAVVLLVVGITLSRRGAETVDGQVASNAKEATSNSLAANKKEVTFPLTPHRRQPRMGRKHKVQGGVSRSERNPGNSAIKQPSPERATAVDNQIAAIAPFGASINTESLPGVDTPGFMLPPAAQAENAILPPDKNTNEPEMLKMEFQTADPNIRIIWLTPKEPVRTTPAEGTK